MPFSTLKHAASTMVLMILVLVGSPLHSQDLNKRYGFEINSSFFPQKTPQEAVLAVVKAIENRRIDYLLAQLADPEFVDDAVAAYKAQVLKGGDAARTFLAFDRLVNETSQFFLEDPTILKELRRFGKDEKTTDWKIDDNKAEGSHKEIQGRKVFLRKLEDRWFLENRQQ
jgi:hypothetical protein